MPLACFNAKGNVSTHWKQTEGMSLHFDVIVLRNLIRLFTQKFPLNRRCCKHNRIGENEGGGVNQHSRPHWGVCSILMFLPQIGADLGV